MQMEQETEVLGKIPDRANGVIDGEVGPVGRGRNEQHHFTASIKLLQKLFAVEEPRIWKLCRRSMHCGRAFQTLGVVGSVSGDLQSGTFEAGL